MSVEFGDNSVAPLTTGQRKFPQYTRPFDLWEAIARIYPNQLEVHRFMRQPEVDRARLWYRRRAHAPCDVRVQSWQFPACPQVWFALTLLGCHICGLHHKLPARATSPIFHARVTCRNRTATAWRWTVCGDCANAVMLPL
jgi:hypothetical protein